MKHVGLIPIRFRQFISKGQSSKWIEYSTNSPRNVFDDARVVIRGRPWSPAVVNQPSLNYCFMNYKITSYLNGSPSWIMMNFHKKIVSFLVKIASVEQYFCAIWKLEIQLQLNYDFGNKIFYRYNFNLNWSFLISWSGPKAVRGYRTTSWNKVNAGRPVGRSERFGFSIWPNRIGQNKICFMMAQDESAFI